MAEDTGDWQFEVDEVGEESATAGGAAESIEPETVDLENAAFVAAGVVGTVLVFLIAL
ncbi:hypothetical protein [Halobaculum sp. MBLA0143]|uniref:DUF7312 domain-containing protein n=1 Tax=Halobaculum sp. MBLA0143 TaxID=3079933 RepID=UPI003524059E